MMYKDFRNLTFAIAAIGTVSVAAPAAAYEMPGADDTVEAAQDQDVLHHGRDRGKHKGWKNGRAYREGYRDGRYGDHYYDDRRVYYGQPIRRDTRVWRARDGRYYCRKDDGTTGLLVGAAVGGLIGNEVAGRGDKTLGTLLGVVGGAILGREIDRSNYRCR